ncbi:MAG: hypothetical protein KAG26_03635 [Methylococcales bacterium]|nr:hypothetical protein [Methylococcales bacterium]
MKNLFFLLLLINIIYCLGQYSPTFLNTALFGEPSPQAQIRLLSETSESKE